jgi:hypothetical protein
MMISMTRLLAPALLLGLLTPAFSAPAQGPNAELGSVGTIYVLPMASGMEQFLAHQVAKQGLYEVTTDPLRADAFLSDFVGTTFELRVEELIKTARDKQEKEAEEQARKEAEKSGTAPKKAAKKDEDEEAQGVRGRRAWAASAAARGTSSSSTPRHGACCGPASTSPRTPAPRRCRNRPSG